MVLPVHRLSIGDCAHHGLSIAESRPAGVPVPLRGRASAQGLASADRAETLPRIDRGFARVVATLLRHEHPVPPLRRLLQTVKYCRAM